MQTVHVRVSEADTGPATPVRIRFSDAAGNYYAPFGRLTKFPTGPNQDVGGNLMLGVRPYAYIDGTCEISLPVGPVEVEIHKGPEYAPLRSCVELGPGKLALRFTIQRHSDCRGQRWYSGDGRAQFLTPHAALLEAAAEDLAVVNLLIQPFRLARPADESVRTLPNILAFSGQQPALANAQALVVVNTLNTHPVLGSLSLLNCHRLVFPLTFGGTDGSDDWSLAAWCDQCHRKGGLVVWARTAHESATFAFGEPLPDLILGKVDAFEIDFFEDSPFDVLPTWYTLLQAGLRVPLVGASGKESNGKALGMMRTYARLLAGEEFNYAAWIEAIRAGRTFVTNGPLLQFTIEDKDPGATISCRAGAMLKARATAFSHVPFDHLELTVNGEVLASARGGGDPCVATLDFELKPKESAWVAARCRGEHLLVDRPAAQRVFAHTSAIYLEVDGRPFRPQEAARTRLAGELDKMLSWLHHDGRFEDAKHRNQLAAIFADARKRLQPGPE